MSTKDTTQKPVTQVTTGLVRLSYFNAWKADEDGKFRTAILIPKSDEVTVGKIKAALKELTADAIKKFGFKNGKLPPTFKLPLRDGDEEKADDDNYADMYFLNATSKQKPGIVGLEKGADNKLKPITEEAEVYSGCYARVSLNFYIFDVDGNKGIAAGLNNIQKVKDGEPLAGKSNADADFEEEYVDEDDDPAFR